VSLPELAEEADAPLALAGRLLELGQIRPLPDGRFDPRDEAILTTASALLDAGIAEDDLAWVIEEARGGFDVIGKLYEPPTPRSAGTYADLRADLGPVGERLTAIYAAFGLPEPIPGQHLREDEEAIIRGFAEIWQVADPGGDADLRVARLSGETSRRLMEGWLDAWDATARPGIDSQGAPRRPGGTLPSDPADPEQNPTIRGAVLVRSMVSWLHERQLERTLNARIIDAFETALVGAGRLRARPESPPAVAFVDLSGFTTMTELRGDEAAAIAAARLQDLAHAAAGVSGGRVVKLLGDGVLMRFASAATAIRSVLDLLDAIPAAGLEAGHAGVAAGRLVIRDGDVFGATVNLASRIAGHAGPGQVVVEEGAVVALPDGVARFEPIGRVTLKGIAMPVSLWVAKRIETGSG
jgi:adenylate cyclase